NDHNMHFGVREHAMGSIANGMALHGGMIPYTATFLIFSDYMRPAIRMGALMGQRVVYIFTHDSIGLGEDGPTHQPVEHLASLRAMHNLTVIRPADANEVVYAWRAALERKDGPTMLVLTRQKLSIFDRNKLASADGLLQGAYVLSPATGAKPDVILIASGSEVELVVAAQAKLAEEQVDARVVSMPSWELFAAQTEAYRNEVLPPEVKARLAIEAGSPFGWRQWVGDAGAIIGIEKFGASAPAEAVYENYGLTVENVVVQAKRVVE
ncbi:transketolase, partial [candidate division KSB1 bacterium]|nr:transketolase [candidate division KSB1 bacterium]